jgi:hypothetical protein
MRVFLCLKREAQIMLTSYKEKSDWFLALIASGIQGNALAVAFIISSFINGEEGNKNYGWAWPTHEDIAAGMGRKGTKADRNQITEWVATLQKFGWLQVEVKGISTGGKKNFYTLTYGRTYEKKSRDPEILDPRPTFPYPETQESLPRDPLFLGNKSKGKEKEEVKIKIKSEDKLSEVKENDEGNPASPGHISSLTSKEDCFSLTPKDRDSLDSEESIPKPRKTGFGINDPGYITNAEAKARREETKTKKHQNH